MQLKSPWLILIAFYLNTFFTYGEINNGPYYTGKEQIQENIVDTPTPRVNEFIDGKYIVVLNSNVTISAVQTQRLFGTLLEQVIDATSENDDSHIQRLFSIGNHQGFTGKFSSKLLEALKNHSDIAYVEPDQIVRAAETQNKPPNWGLARISHRKGPEPHYEYVGAAGQNVNVYIIDSGIYVDNADFGGRAHHGINLRTGEGQPDGDCHSHGTHVAGIIGGSQYGVAKLANLIGVKVLDCRGAGQMSDVISAIDWITKSHISSKKRISIVNLSLSGGYSYALNTAIENASRQNIIFVVAAGNDNDDACYNSPASSPAAITVGATDYSDDRAWYSNYGQCVDILAPGSEILSAGISSPTSSLYKSGTSMAAPHVAGTLALWASTAPPGASTDMYKWLLQKRATSGVIGNLPSGTLNLLLYTSPDVE